ncbi:MAG: VWA domain-containing protein [Clostridia bacterium]|nr:VWA domain-containing protein [Clostridia bacterium]
MKNRIFLLLTVLLLIFALAACGGTDSSSGGKGSAPSGAKERPDGEMTRPEASMDVSGDYSGYDGYVISDGSVGEGNGIDRQIGAGQITASAWDDNENYDEWKALFDEPVVESDGNEGTKVVSAGGKFLPYKVDDWGAMTQRRVKVTVTKGGEPVAGAEASFFDDEQREYRARTNASGVAYLFPSAGQGRVIVRSGEVEATADFTAEDRDLIVEVEEAIEKENVIKLMLVVDATGSMGDEMEYLAVELADVIRRVSEESDARIDLALLFYRDKHDEEEFAYTAFRTVTEETGLSEQLAVLAAQEAIGGGDYPEAMDQAMEMAVNEDWGEENATRIIILVLDAPPHDKADKKSTYASALTIAAAKGIRVCPVLCSGADTLCEYVVRLGALCTGGTFVYVTDDSGIGGEHLDPEIPDVPVEYLNELLIRVIIGHHTGDFGTPKSIYGDDKGQQTEPGKEPEEEGDDSALIEEPSE